MAKPEIIHHLPLKKVLEINRAFKNSNEPSFAHPHPQYFRFFLVYYVYSRCCCTSAQLIPFVPTKQIGWSTRGSFICRECSSSVMGSFAYRDNVLFLMRREDVLDVVPSTPPMLCLFGKTSHCPILIFHSYSYSILCFVEYFSLYFFVDVVISTICLSFCP